MPNLPVAASVASAPGGPVNFCRALKSPPRRLHERSFPHLHGKTFHHDNNRLTDNHQAIIFSLPIKHVNAQNPFEQWGPCRNRACLQSPSQRWRDLRSFPIFHLPRSGPELAAYDQVAPDAVIQIDWPSVANRFNGFSLFMVFTSRVVFQISPLEAYLAICAAKSVDTLGLASRFESALLIGSKALYASSFKRSFTRNQTSA